MNPTPAALLDWAPAFALVFARVGAAMVLLPGLGETVAPAAVRIGLALSITILLLPDLQPMIPSVPEAGMRMGLMMVGEVITGLWFGWLARMIVVALPIGAQFIGYLTGLSSVLQPDPELGAQSSVFGKLFGMVAPMMLLATGLYKFMLTAMDGLFRLIPVGQILPAGDTTQVAIRAVGVGFALALQLASPFVVLGIAWQLAIGLMARIIPRVQIYFVSVSGQIMVGLALLAITSSAIILAWHDSTKAFFLALPGGG
jgi:flagellar biosynthetic protein FliR